MVGKGIGVFIIGREAVVGVAEGDLHETNGGVWRKRGPEFLDIEWSVDEGYGVVRSLF